MCRDCDRRNTLAAAYRKKRGGAPAGVARCRNDDLGADFVLRGPLMLPKAKAAKSVVGKPAAAKSRSRKGAARKPARPRREVH